MPSLSSSRDHVLSSARLLPFSTDSVSISCWLRYGKKSPIYVLGICRIQLLRDLHLLLDFSNYNFSEPDFSGPVREHPDRFATRRDSFGAPVPPPLVQLCGHGQGALNAGSIAPQTRLDRVSAWLAGASMAIGAANASAPPGTERAIAATGR